MHGTDTDGDAQGRPLKLEEMVCFSIYSAGHAFNRLYKPLLEPLGLTYPQFLVMTALWAEDDQSVGSLGDKLYLDSSTLTPLLKRLEATGFVGRTRDLADERVVRIRLTERGREVRHKAAEVPGCIVAASGTTLDRLMVLQAEVAALRDALAGHGAD